MEPDECFYISNELAVRGKDFIDLSVDPPPDLAIEIENTRSAIDKLAIYSGLGVREVWRFDGKSLEIVELGANQIYVSKNSSRYFSRAQIDAILRFVDQRNSSDETSLMKRFRAWVREDLGVD